MHCLKINLLTSHNQVYIGGGKRTFGQVDLLAIPHGCPGLATQTELNQYRFVGDDLQHRLQDFPWPRPVLDLHEPDLQMYNE